MTFSDGTTSTLLPRKPGRWKRILLVLVVFLSGLVIGGAGATIFIARQVRYAMQHPNEIPTRLTTRLTRRLGLDPEQARQVHDILVLRVGHLEELRLKMQPALKSELQGCYQDVRKILDANQQMKWDRLYDEFQDNWFTPIDSSSAPNPPSSKPADMP